VYHKVAAQSSFMTFSVDACAHVQSLVVKMAIVFEEYTTKEQSSVVHFFVGQMIFLFTVRSVCCVKSFSLGSRCFADSPAYWGKLMHMSVT
jgi:hypothetical protein